MYVTETVEFTVDSKYVVVGVLAAAALVGGIAASTLGVLETPVGAITGGSADTDSADAGGQNNLKTWGTSQDDPRVIEVTAEQFQFNPSTITAKQGEWIQIKATSTDVPHGLAIREYGVNLQMRAGETVRSDPFRVTETGTFSMPCSVYCGAGHGSMRGTLKVTAQ